MAGAVALARISTMRRSFVEMMGGVLLEFRLQAVFARKEDRLKAELQRNPIISTEQMRDSLNHRPPMPDDSFAVR